MIQRCVPQSHLHLQILQGGPHHLKVVELQSLLQEILLDSSHLEFKGQKLGVAIFCN